MGIEERESEKRPESMKGLRKIAKGTIIVASVPFRVLREIGNVVVEATREVEAEEQEPKKSGWLDPDDDDIQFEHNGAPYNR